MKNSYVLSFLAHRAKECFLLFCICLATNALAQQKPEFGFVVKAGNAGWPINKSDLYYSYQYTRNTERRNIGRAFSMGVWYSIPLNKRVRLSTELLYRYSAQKSELSFWHPGSGGGGFPTLSSNRQTHRMNHSSLSLPVKFHFPFNENGKTTLVLGAGISQFFALNSAILYEYEEGDGTLFPDYYVENRLIGRNQFRLNYNLTAGLFRRLDPKTAIGIEYTFERTHRPYNFFSTNFCDCFCICQTPFDNIPNLNSFSVSLRHNILD
jgi:hypothetical protein